MPLTFGQPTCADGRDEASRGPVEKHIWWFKGMQFEIDGDGMTLVRTNARSRFVESKALLIARLDNLLDEIASQRMPMALRQANELVQIRPTARVELESDHIWLVTEDQAQELAGCDEISCHSGLLRHGD